MEAPAGCGKTYQGADYARELAISDTSTRLLIMTHTHAACSAFADHIKGVGSRVEIRTIDSIIARIASAYHVGLDLPADVAMWARQRQEGHAELALKVSALLRRYPMIASSLARRHPVVVCDEHQDSSGDQHSVIMALLSEGAKLRLFADPMQRIFKDKSLSGACRPYDWNELTGVANAFEQLDTPRRWEVDCPDLGAWVMRAREGLKEGSKVDLRSNRPQNVNIVFAENQAQRNMEYRLASSERKQVDEFEQREPSLLILTRYNPTAQSFRSFFNRRIPLWEGHTRDGLERLADDIRVHEGDAVALAEATVTFMSETGKGFSASAYGNMLQQEAREGCTSRRRGKPARIQELARLLIAEPDHHGVAKMLHRISELRGSDKDLADIKVDCQREFSEAVWLGDFDTVEAGLHEIAHRRTYSRPKPPTKAISTIHKAKGLERGSVIVMPCDRNTFPDNVESRCLLYVALSRASSRLLLVVSRTNPSPLLDF
ncbi:MAG: ATP-binding domain-containing protein [Gemmatimonadota bacterium]|nr:ATP-binding domain-containing protein [Gemmatimonadota bacterium]